jgi:hypothetical protein
MTNQYNFKIPTIKFNVRSEFEEFLKKTRPEFVFEKLEEVTNPIGRQWNLTITTRIQSEDIGMAIVEFKEELYEYPEIVNDITANWLKKACPFIKNFYKGIIGS